ncbi:restriction endonuclease subunit S [Microbacterium aerolatum]|uniref:Type I restriction endonuclease n=1 Tax=Microbacterium aerolatum TaxID=153731 RepID=A0A511AM08_9MICO|nr:restriction endonuclease subunit S [Microbacterium aerolatum]GEK87911.1 type I restriction endonuclease [Microbacterium aerolatum]GGB22156.1 type I restriction endonuclease [Microbacterium aerolatum]
MSEVAFGRTVRLVTERSTSRRGFRIGLEAVEKGTGRLNFDPEVQYEGDGIAFRRGDVLFGKLRPSLRKAWLADTDGDAVGDFHVYRPIRELMTSRYLAYVVLSAPFLDPVIASVYGAKMPRADWTQVRNTKVWVPGVTEQRAIADYLDRETAQIDAFIAKNEELIALLTERRAAIVAYLITGKGAVGSAERIDSGVDWIGTIPSHWEVRPLRWSARIRTGTTPSGDSVFADEPGQPWIRPDDLDVSGGPSIASRWLTENGAAQGKPAAAGSTLLCTIGATLGKAGRVTRAVYFNQQITALKWALNDEFLFWAFAAARAAVVRLSVGNTLPILNNEKLAGLRIPVPPLEEQSLVVGRIKEQTARLDAAIDTARRGVVLARERRAALISAAVTGKIDLGVVV